MSEQPTAGPRTSDRSNQKLRTRAAILAAAQHLMAGGAAASMADVARAALVSEATAYRYYPSLAGLLAEAEAGLWPTQAQAHELLAGATGIADRVRIAAGETARRVLRHQQAIRIVAANGVANPGDAARRAAYRFVLLHEAVAPFAQATTARTRRAADRLELTLAVVLSAEAVLALADQLHLTDDAARRSVVSTATTLADASAELRR